MEKMPTEEQIRKSGAYKKASNRAQQYVDEPERLNELMEQASRKAQSHEHGPLERVWDDFLTLMRMMKAYAAGTYREIPIQTLLMFVTTVVYFVMPIDLIPDFIFLLGLLDDAALIGFTIRVFQADLQRFREWEASSENEIDQTC